MGRDIDLVDPETGEIITHIYISGNFWFFLGAFIKME